MSCLLALHLLSAGIDQQMYDGIRRGWHSRTMDVVFSAVTSPGNMYAVGGSAAAFCIAGRAELRRSASLAACSWLGATAVLVATRAAVGRPRPDDPDPDWIASAFPSSHTTSYFAAATVYALKFPKLAPALGVAGALVALSRVYLGRHWPSDVVAGAVLGTGAGLLAVQFERPITRLLCLEDSRIGVLQPSAGGLGLVAVSF